MEYKEIKILKAKESDIEAAVEIAVSAWSPIRDGYRDEIGTELYEAFFLDANKSWHEFKKQAVKSELLSDNGYVAKDGEKVVGFISFTVNKTYHYGTICSNAVHPDYRGKGIGGLMYRYVFDCLRSEGIRYVNVTTGGDEGHAPARRAYEKAGFEKFIPSVCYYKKL